MVPGPIAAYAPAHAAHAVAGRCANVGLPHPVGCPVVIDAAVILCAGGSRRMGRSKGLLVLRGEPLLLHHVRALGQVTRRVVVVLGADADAHRAVLPRSVDVVENPDWATTWPADSLSLALRDADIDGACLVTPVDVPPATPSVLAALEATSPPAVPVDPEGRPGHPVLLDRDLVASIRRRAPEGGLRALLGAAARVPVDDPDVALDFDDPPAWSRYLARTP